MRPAMVQCVDAGLDTLAGVSKSGSPILQVDDTFLTLSARALFESSMLVRGGACGGPFDSRCIVCAMRMNAPKKPNGVSPVAEYSRPRGFALGGLEARAEP